MTKSMVVVQKVAGNSDIAVSKLFGQFPGMHARLEECENVFVKINAVYFHPHLHTSLSLIESVIRHIKNADPKKHIYLMENCSQGNFTRLCFATIGVDGMAKNLRVHCLYLDEEKSVNIELGEGDCRLEVEFPKVLYDNLIVNRKKNLYINMPVLKAHCQTQMTAGIKNQKLFLSSEESAIRLVCPALDEAWIPTGGEPIVGSLDRPLRPQKALVVGKVTGAKRNSPEKD